MNEISLQNMIGRNTMLAEAELILLAMSLISSLIINIFLTKKLTAILTHITARDDLNLAEIVYMEVRNKRCFAYNINGSVTSCGSSLATVIERIGATDYEFLQINRSVIINSQYKNALSKKSNKIIVIEIADSVRELAYTNSHTREVEILLNGVS